MKKTLCAEAAAHFEAKAKDKLIVLASTVSDKKTTIRLHHFIRVYIFGQNP
jgi:hypothetical protein